MDLESYLVTNSSSWSWLQDLSEVRPGGQAILGGNKIAFYGIHCAAILITFISLVASVVTVIFIICVRENNGQYGHKDKTRKWDFSDRFPLYMAIADILWAFSNLSADHVILLVTQKFPSETVAAALGVSLLFFLAYQQIMSGALALFTYLKVVRRSQINFGRGEWKLQLLTVTYLLICAAIYLPMNSFGATGYWFLTNISHPGGRALQLFSAIISTVNTGIMILSYILIRRRVCRLRRRLSTFDFVCDGSCKHNAHTTAVRCLSTFIYIAILIYVPISFVSWSVYFFAVFGKIEPATCFLAVVVANSCGWSNAIGYWYNRKVKIESAAARKFSNVSFIPPFYDVTNSAKGNGI